MSRWMSNVSPSGGNALQHDHEAFAVRSERGVAAVVVAEQDLDVLHLAVEVHQRGRILAVEDDVGGHVGGLSGAGQVDGKA